jgi:hypothetical protein
LFKKEKEKKNVVQLKFSNSTLKVQALVYNNIEEQEMWETLECGRKFGQTSWEACPQKVRSFQGSGVWTIIMKLEYQIF